MTFRTEKDAFVWIWLPGETEPVVAGRLEADNGYIMFNYGKSYLERISDSKPAIAIYEPELVRLIFNNLLQNMCRVM